MTMTDEVKKMVEGKTVEEVRAMIKGGEIEVPTVPEDRKEFLIYVSKNPDKRDVPVETDGENKIDDNDKPAESTDNSEDKDTDKGKSIADDTAPSKEPWWKEKGYESEEKVEEALANAIDLSSKLQSSLDSLNAKEGKRGQQYKKLKEEHDNVLKERDELRIKSMPKVERPEKPERPNVDDFEDGVSDDGYISAMNQYHDDREKYVDDLSAYNKYENDKALEEMRQSVTKKEGPEAIDDDLPEPSSAKWDAMWSEVEKFQKDFDLVTTVPVKDILDNINKKKSDDPVVKSRAVAFLGTIPAGDKEKYEKIRVAAEAAYIFTVDGPEPKYRKGIATAIQDNDLLGEGKLFNNVKPSTLTAEEEEAARVEQQRKNDETVTPIPSSQASGNTDMPSGNMSDKDKQKRLKDLVTKYNVVLDEGLDAQKKFEATEEFAEFIKLRKELGSRVPSSYKR